MQQIMKILYAGRLKENSINNMNHITHNNYNKYGPAWNSGKNAHFDHVVARGSPNLTHPQSWNKEKSQRIPPVAVR